MYKLLTVSVLFILFIFFGGVLVSVVGLIPGGVPRTIVTLIFGVAFAGAFLWLLLTRLQRVYAGKGRVWVEMLIGAINVALLLFAFAEVYRRLGIVDTTQPDATIVHDYLRSAYFSVVTFTTLGYGDMQPQGLARPLACIQALTGYLVLGIIASTSASILQWSAQEHEQKEQKTHR